MDDPGGDETIEEAVIGLGSIWKLSTKWRDGGKHRKALFSGPKLKLFELKILMNARIDHYKINKSIKSSLLKW